MADEMMVKITGLLKEGLDKYSDAKDVLTEQVLENDAMELLGDCSKIAKFLVGSKKLVDRGMFSYFLKGFTIGDETEKEKLDKLKEYIDDEDKAMFISKTLESILNSKSKYASLILGYIINTLITTQKELNPKYIILSDALTHMFDHDIQNIRFIGDYCNYKIYDDRKEASKKKKRDVYFYKKFKKILDENNIDKDILYLTLEKCISYQLMIKKVDSTTELDLDGMDVSYDKETDDAPEISTGTASANTDVEESYSITIVGDLLYELIITLDIK